MTIFQFALFHHILPIFVGKCQKTHFKQVFTKITYSLHGRKQPLLFALFNVQSYVQ